MKQAMTSSGMPLVSQHSFARVPNVTKPRSTFDRSKPYKTTFNAGYWTPVFLDEVLPGDTFQVHANIFARLLSPLSVPIMDNITMDWIAIYCPNRLLWNKFVNQFGEQDNPTDTIDYLTPKVTVPSGGFTLGSLADYFGLPLGVGGVGSAVPLTVSAYPFRMYNLFYNQWVKAQSLVDAVYFTTGNGPDTYSNYNLLQRMKRPDYFTSSLPATQKGSPVEISLVGSAPVSFPSQDNPAIGTNLSGSVDGTLGVINTNVTSGLFTGVSPSTGQTVNLTSFYDQSLITGGTANLSGISAVTINEFRLLATTQQYLELNQRGGTRYPEFLLNHFSVVSSDARLQRVEYLGAGSIPIVTHVVPQTSQTDTTPQANLAGFMTGAGGVSFTRSFEEHGHVMVLVEVRADLTYQQGVEKLWSRQTLYDYYDPIFANIGEQAVLNQEIYAQGTSEDAGVFGYQEYAAEYRFGFGKVTGLMRSGVTGSVAVYNLAQYYTSLPTLNTAWMNDNPDINRIIAVDDQPQFIFDSFWNVKSTRVMPVFSIPGITRV